MWNKVEENLPENGTKVLCLTSDGTIIDAIRDSSFYGGFKAHYFWDKSCVSAVFNCVAWMLKSKIYDEE